MYFPYAPLASTTLQELYEYHIDDLDLFHEMFKDDPLGGCYSRRHFDAQGNPYVAGTSKRMKVGQDESTFVNALPSHVWVAKGSAGAVSQKGRGGGVRTLPLTSKARSTPCLLVVLTHSLLLVYRFRSR